ncbi:MAG: class I SAM-dependent methyltransferase [Candidatus Nanoarchaeia archaeon]
MKFKQKLAEKTGLPIQILPASYQILGHVLLLKLSSAAQRHAKVIAKTILELFPYIQTVALQKGISGVYRVPKIKILAGKKETEVRHKELGCEFFLDVAKIMWSKGNHAERARLVEIVKPNEIILDMFAGIGYWSIPIAKHKPCEIFAIEKRALAFEYLCKNIRLNRVNVIAIKGDCRKILENYSFPNPDRIIMGYFPGTLNFLPSALSVAKKGTVIHFHDLAKNLNELCKQVLTTAKGKVCISSARIVKEYSASKQHYVLDLVVK